MILLLCFVFFCFGFLFLCLYPASCSVSVFASDTVSVSDSVSDVASDGVSSFVVYSVSCF